MTNSLPSCSSFFWCGGKKNKRKKKKEKKRGRCFRGEDRWQESSAFTQPPASLCSEPKQAGQSAAPFPLPGGPAWVARRGYLSQGYFYRILKTLHPVFLLFRTPSLPTPGRTIARAFVTAQAGHAQGKGCWGMPLGSSRAA